MVTLTVLCRTLLACPLHRFNTFALFSVSLADYKMRLETVGAGDDENTLSILMTV